MKSMVKMFEKGWWQQSLLGNFDLLVNLHWALDA
jgi:hypothetical protein